MLCCLLNRHDVVSSSSEAIPSVHRKPEKKREAEKRVIVTVDIGSLEKKNEWRKSSEDSGYSSVPSTPGSQMKKYSYSMSHVRGVIRRGTILVRKMATVCRDSA